MTARIAAVAITRIQCPFARAHPRRGRKKQSRADDAPKLDDGSAAKAVL